MKFTSADHAAQAYLALRYDRLPVVRAINPGLPVREPKPGPCKLTRRRGRGLCGGKRAHETRDGYYVCCTCGRPWPTQILVEPSAKSGNLRPPQEGKLLLVADLAVALAQLPVWHATALLTWAALTRQDPESRMRGLDRMLAESNGEERPLEVLGRLLAIDARQSQAAWHERRVRELLREAREKLESELKRRGMLA